MTPVSASAASSRLVSTVTATMMGAAGLDRRAASSCAASRAAAHHGAAPGGVDVHHPRAESSWPTSTALATVLGMSWNLRSRKTRSPRPASSSTIRGPCAGEELFADLEAADASTQLVGERVRLRRGIDIERDQELVHIAFLTDVPTRSPRRVKLWRRHVVADAVEPASAR